MKWLKSVDMKFWYSFYQFSISFHAKMNRNVRNWVQIGISFRSFHWKLFASVKKQVQNTKRNPFDLT